MTASKSERTRVSNYYRSARQTCDGQGSLQSEQHFPPLIFSYYVTDILQGQAHSVVRPTPHLL
nr:MAG TPA: hypothetical protein [Caudoviricetes sp.]